MEWVMSRINLVVILWTITWLLVLPVPSKAWKISIITVAGPMGFTYPATGTGRGDKRDYVRGFGYQGGAGRGGWNRGNGMDGFGADFKESLTTPGPWTMSLGGFGEMIADPDNRMTLSPDQKDKWGLPLIVFDAAYGENEQKMRIDMMNDAAEMLEAAGLKNVTAYNDESKTPRYWYSRNGYGPHGTRS